MTKHLILLFAVATSCSSPKESKQAASRPSYQASENVVVAWTPNPMVRVSLDADASAAPLSSYIIFAEAHKAYMISGSECVDAATCDPILKENDGVPAEWVAQKVMGSIPGKDILDKLRGKSNGGKVGLKLSQLPLMYVGFRNFSDEINSKGNGQMTVDVVTALGIHSQQISIAGFMKGEFPTPFGCSLSKADGSSKESLDYQFTCDFDFSKMPRVLVLDYEY